MPRRRSSSRRIRLRPQTQRRATSPSLPTPRKLSRPVAVAITGGIGAGKSEALYAFQKAGAATVSSDEIVHHLLRTDPEVRDAIVRELGDGVLAEDGSIDRARVAEIVFADREKLLFLEALLHPKVAAEYLA